MKITKENFEAFTEMYEELEERIETIMEIKLKGTGEYFESFTFENGQVSVTTTISSGCGCCSDETEWHTINFEDLFVDYEELKIKFDKEKEEEKKRREKKRQEDLKVAEERNLAQKKAQYLKLKQEFEN